MAMFPDIFAAVAIATASDYVFIFLAFFSSRDFFQTRSLFLFYYIIIENEGETLVVLVVLIVLVVGIFPKTI